MWNMGTVQAVVPIIIIVIVGSLGSVTKDLEKWLEKLDVNISISVLKYTTRNCKDFEKTIGALE